jgi:hypothetical protein
MACAARTHALERLSHAQESREASTAAQPHSRSSGKSLDDVVSVLERLAPIARPQSLQRAAVELSEVAREQQRHDREPDREDADVAPAPDVEVAHSDEQ